MEKESKFENDMIRRLDVISIFLLAQKGLNQKEIGKILGVSSDKIKIFTVMPTKKSFHQKNLVIKHNGKNIKS